MAYPEWANVEDRASIARARNFNGVCIAGLLIFEVVNLSFLLSVGGWRPWSIVGVLSPLVAIYAIGKNHRTFMERLELLRSVTGVEELIAIGKVPMAAHLAFNLCGVDPYVLYRRALADNPVPKRRRHF